MSDASNCEIQIGGRISRKQLVTLVEEFEATNGNWDDSFKGDPKTIDLTTLTSLSILQHDRVGGEYPEAEEYLKEQDIPFDRYGDACWGGYDAEARFFRPDVYDKTFLCDMNNQVVVSADAIERVLTQAKAELIKRVEYIEPQLRELAALDVPDIPDFACLETLCRCENCRSKWLVTELRPVKDIGQRVALEERMPDGECPECGAVCHTIE